LPADERLGERVWLGAGLRIGNPISESRNRLEASPTACCLTVDDVGGKMCGDKRPVVLIMADVPSHATTVLNAVLP
jgi:hypothetical protein